MNGIFVSHTHSDQALADAIAALIDALFERRVPVNYSSKKELDGGIAPGEDWFRWIVNQVREADAAFILLTPASIQKPWVIWELGVVAGAAFATSPDKARVFPITFGIKASDVPTPFARTQLITGTAESDMLKLMDDLLDRFDAGFTRRDISRFGERRPVAVKEYLARIDAILVKLPMLITEAGIQEWLGRLDEIDKERRYSEAAVLENWLDVNFGRDAADRQRPLDVRLHRRLGELYAAGGQASDAARQFELARQLAPRDIFLLRRLGKAYLDRKDSKRAGATLDEIESLDPTAFERNPENAALKARWLEESGNRLGARDVLAAAYASNSGSYYLGDRLGQLLVALGESEKAKEVYAQVRRTVDDLSEQNVWTHATALTAAVVCGDDAGTEQELERLRELRPSREELDSIERGLGKLLKHLGRNTQVIDKLRKTEVRA